MIVACGEGVAGTGELAKGGEQVFRKVKGGWLEQGRSQGPWAQGSSVFGMELGLLALPRTSAVPRHPHSRAGRAVRPHPVLAHMDVLAVP